MTMRGKGFRVKPDMTGMEGFRRWLILKRSIKKMRFPKPLQAGSRVALTAPSGPQPPENLDAAVQSVRELSLEPVVYPSCHARHGYLAGSDALRAEDLNRAFADDSIEGIICIRGGYGAQRLLPLLDFNAMRRHPKLLCGYSDITVLHIQLQQQCGLVSMHTPMPGTEWYQRPDEYTMNGLRQALFGPLPDIIENPAGIKPECLVGGSAAGRLWGGNLSLVAATLGTPYEIDTKGRILFLEDIDEEPYCIDRMLLRLRQSGKLSDCAGILLGPFTNCVSRKEGQSLDLPQIFRELLYDLGKPVLSSFQCGHVLPTASLPLGALAIMDADAGTLEFLEGYPEL